MPTLPRNELERAVYAGRIVLAQKAYQDNDIAKSRSSARTGPARAGPARPARLGVLVSARPRARRTCTPACATPAKGWNFIHSLAVSPDGRVRGHVGGAGHGGSVIREVATGANRPARWSSGTWKPAGGRRRTEHVGAVDAVADQPRRPPPGNRRRDRGRAPARPGDGQAPEGAAAGRRDCLQPGVLPPTVARWPSPPIVPWSSGAPRRTESDSPSPIRRPGIARASPSAPMAGSCSLSRPQVNDVRGWDPDTGAEVPVPLRKEPAQALAFSLDGQLVGPRAGQGDRGLGYRPTGAFGDGSRPTRNRWRP